MVTATAVPDHFLTKWNTADQSPLVGIGSGLARFLTVHHEVPTKGGGKLRSACDVCRKARVKCTGANPCRRCEGSSARCFYSPSLRNGRLKAKNSPAARSANGQSPLSREYLHRTLPESPKTINLQPTITKEFSASSNDYFSTRSLEELANSDFLQDSLEYLQFPSLAGNLSISRGDAAGNSFRSLPVNSFLPDPSNLMSESASHVSISQGTESLSPSVMMPGYMFDSSFLLGSQAGSQCSCLKTQLHCVAELCGNLDHDKVISIRLDTILETARTTTGESISQFINCRVCKKTSFGFILITVALQRLVQMLCHVGRYGVIYVQRARASIGVYQLSEDEDRLHKQMLVLSSLRLIQDVLRELEGAAKLQQQQKDELGPQTQELNLLWVLQTLGIIRKQVELIIATTSRNDWGLRIVP